jgi:hypothetical protein
MGHALTVTDGGLIVGGWVLARAVPTPPWLHDLQLPELLTLSDCIQDDLPRPEPWFGDWFHDVGQAREAARRTPGPEPIVVTVAMLPEMAEAFVAEWESEPSPWFDLLHQGLPLPPEAKVVGFEVVGAEAPLDFHSWHCHRYAADVHATFLDHSRSG